jgi:menaquinone-dependent protoporphyrinogen IX oxidase
MENIIIYGSKYGTTKSYAQELTKKTGFPNIDYREIECLEKYSTIIYLGGLYAGGVKGLKNTFKKFPLNSKQKLIVVTVGLADPKIKTNTDHIKLSLEKQLPKELYDNSKIFHLRGGIDYKKLNFKHTFMMKALLHKIKKLPVEKQTAETKALIETFNKNVNFVDLETLNEIINYI